MFASEIRRKRIRRLRAFSKLKWQVDEVFFNVNGECHYPWCAVDPEGEVLEAAVIKRRKKRAALKFLKKLMKRQGCAGEVVTDHLASCKAALRELDVSKNRPVDGSTNVLRIRMSHFDE